MMKKVASEPTPDDLHRLAERIDRATDDGDASGLALLDEICARHISRGGAQSSLLWYYRANIQSALRAKEDVSNWNWRHPQREREILFLRRAKNDVGFDHLDQISRAQITTNLANGLSFLGRSIDALGLYDSALNETPGFAMALGNRGQARMYFAKTLSDHGHANIGLLDAYDDLVAAAGPGAIWDGPYVGVREQFLAMAEHISALIEIESVRNVVRKNYELGRSKVEAEYRQWALAEQLFLNPLNVFGRHTVAATDRFGLPSHRSPVGNPPHFISWFNQLKQEFCMARLLLFEAERQKGQHFSDRELMLVDTLEFSVFGIRHEKMRLAFRVAYGLLDKVAGFLNAYFHLGEKPARVNLRNIWLTKDGRSVRPEFAQKVNWPLRGLYWLAFDLLGSESLDTDVIAPEAAELSQLRNALEHRCLVFKEFDTTLSPGILETCSIEKFRGHTYMMVRLARASIMYLSLAVGIEEEARSALDTSFAFPMELPTYNGH